MTALPLLLLGVGCATPDSKNPGSAGTTGAAGTGSGTTGAAGTGVTDPYAGYAAKALHVSGNKILDTTGATFRFLGVNRSGSEYMCVPPTMGSYVFDGATGPNSITAMLSWHINTVRIPINESCWLGIAGTLVSADQYKSEIVDYVQRLHARGLYVMLDLHWSAPGTTLATRQTTMAFESHAYAFWTSVATTFKTDPMMIFDLYNEPILVANDGAGNGPVGDANAAWNCWLSGCAVSTGTTAGMQRMLNSIREAGATQVVVATGIDWGHQLSGWQSHKPNDPTGNLIAGFHVYDRARSTCTDTACWDRELGLAATVPVVTGELGQTDCQRGYIDMYMNYADAKGIGYLGWAWNPQNCAQFPALISNVDGTPTAFGQGLKDHLLQINP